LARFASAKKIRRFYDWPIDIAKAAFGFFGFLHTVPRGVAPNVILTKRL
jgi:hypothetical protein